MQTFIKTYRVTHIKITLYKKKQAALHQCLCLCLKFSDDSFL